MKRKLPILVIIALFSAVCFSFYSYNNYKIHQGFTSIPLSFDPYTGVSSYTWNGAQVRIQGGFIKGTMKEKSTQEDLLLRALSPTPKITVIGSTQPQTYHIRLENVNPLNFTTSEGNENFKILDSHTVLFTLEVGVNEVKSIETTLKDPDSEFVILGDNRNGYQTFSDIIDQINAVHPAFVIDNGDLVFGGEANRYRLFYETVSKLRVPLYTTLGNHDIRKNGRDIYTLLFGPPYFSFDYQNSHFIFLDSSRGWIEKRSIPEEQYLWLENDLERNQGKRLFVFTHIPPTDPRSDLQPNTFPDIPGVKKTGIIEDEFNKLSGMNNLDHAFPDKEEAKRFENLMTQYKVDTVFLSHIHSYFSFLKDNVRYIISGGAGAELLTKDSYYHYMRVKTTTQENYLEVVTLPSPPNQLQDRYIAAAQLFASSTYKEYTPIILALGFIFIFIALWLLWAYRQSLWFFTKNMGIWLKDTLQYAISKYKEIFKGKK